MIFKKKNESGPEDEQKLAVSGEVETRPRSDGIRKKAVSQSLAMRPETTDPHEEEDIIITESISKPAQESGIKLDDGALTSGLKDSEIKDQGADDTFSFSTAILRSRGSGREFWWWYLWGGAGAALVVFLLFSTVLSRVTVTLKPRIDFITLPATVFLLDSSVSRVLVEQKVIPAERLEFDKKVKAEFEATGRKLIEEKARGKAKIYNRFSSSSQTLVGGTRFLTDNGLLYRLPKTTVVPGAKIEEGKIVPQSVEVELWADTAGEGGNLNGEIPLKIPGFKGSAKYEGFYASVLGGFSGGFTGEAKVVSGDDLKKAQEAVTKELHEELGRDMARKISADFKTLDGLREIEIIKLATPELNSKQDRFSVEATGKGVLLIFKEEDLVKVFKELVFAAGETREYVNGSAGLNYQIKTIDLAKGKGEVIVAGSFKARARVTESEFAQLIAGKKKGSMAEILKSRGDVSAFSVAFFPPWLSKAPASLAKIKLIIKDE